MKKMMFHKDISDISKVRFSCVMILCLWILLSFCFCQGFAGVDSSGVETADLELRVMSFNIRYGTANDGDNHWKNRREMVFNPAFLFRA